MILMWLELCAGLIVIVCIGLAAFMLGRPKSPITIEKNLDSGNVRLKIRMNRDLKRLEVIRKDGGIDGTVNRIDGDVSFVRNNLKKGEEVEFVFSASSSPTKLIVDDEKGTFTLVA